MSRLFHTSDLHFGAEDTEALAWFARLVETERPDAVVVTGDITQRARGREFRAAARWLSELPVPVTVEPGNHDLPYFNPLERLLWPYRRLREVQGMVDAELELPDCAVVPLKTTARFQWRLNWSHGRASAGSLGRALRHARRVAPEKMVLVAAHHPLIGMPETGTTGLTHGGSAALTKLVACGADAVLTGHVHVPFDVEREVSGRPVRLIGAGTLSQRVREHPPSFNEIRVGQGGIEVIRRLAA